MSNPHLELLKQRGKKTSGKSDAQGLLAVGSIAKQGYDIQNSAPDPRHDYADLLQQSAQDMKGDQPARGWRALVSGMLEGASTGLKSKVSQEKKEKAEKIGRVFEWLEANGMAMAEQNRLNALRQKADETLEPLLKDYAQNMGNMAPLAREKYAEHILNRYNEMIGSDYELVSIDQVNPLKITVKSPQHGNALFVQDFSEKVGGVDADLYQKAVDYEDRQYQLEQQRLAVSRDNANTYHRDVESRWSPEKQFSVGVGKEGAKNFAQSLKKAEDENYALEDALYTVKDLKESLGTGNVMTGDTALSWAKRLTGKAFNTEGMTQTQLYDALVAELYEFAKGTLSANPKDIEFLTKKMPDSSKTPKALGLMIEITQRVIERKIARNDALIKKMPDYMAREQGERVNGMAESQRQAQQKTPQQAPASTPPVTSTPDQNTVRVISPEGVTGMMSRDDFNKALQQGLGFKLA